MHIMTLVVIENLQSMYMASICKIININPKFHCLLTRINHINPRVENYLRNSPKQVLVTSPIPKLKQAKTLAFVPLASFAQTISIFMFSYNLRHHDPYLIIFIPSQSFLHQNPNLMILPLW
jgi:hypothetical protein